MKLLRSTKLPMWLWVIQIIMGVGLVIYVLDEHLPGLSTIIIGRNIFDAYAEILDKFIPPFLLTLIIIALFAAIAIHGGINLRIISKIYRKPDQTISYAARFKHGHTFYWIFQCITGSLLAFFLIVHLWITHMMIAPGEKLVEFVRTNARLGNNWYILFYICFLSLLLYHALNGTRAVLVKLGIVTTKKEELLMIGIIGLLAFAFLSLGLITLYFFRIS